jgi:hypothetical protein
MQGLEGPGPTNIQHISNSTSVNIQHICLYMKKGVQSFGIKVFSRLPQSLKKAASNIEQFKTAVKRYLLTYLLLLHR